MVRKIRKRDGDVVLFQSDKIEGAIWKAARAVGGNDKNRSKVLCQMVVDKLDEIYGETGLADIEIVQDLVEKILIEEGHAKVAKAFILYRKSHDELRNVKGLFDTIEVVEDYIGLDDWMVKENSNMAYSLQGLNNYISTKIVSNYWMRRIYPEAIRQVHESGDLHIHDLGTLGAYCVGWDLKDLLMVGFKGVRGKVESKPPKHLRAALGQIVNFFYTLQGETAGAQAFSNFDTLLAPFVKHDKLSYKEVKQAMQEFVFNLAVPTRVGFQTPFTNITMDLEVPSYMKDEHVIVGGQPQMETYKEFENEMKMINRAFAECMLEGDATGQVFTFPIPTYNITKGFDFDNPEYDLIWEMTAKYGIPYFSNFVNSDMKPEDARSMCCRLRLDQTELRKRGGGLFGANPQTGSIGVVTINMPRLGFLSTDEDDFFARLDRLMELAKESLEIKRKTIENFTKMGLYPYTKFYLRQVNERFENWWKNHFSTIGLLGMNEAIINLIPGENITTMKGCNFALKVLDFMRDRLGEYQEETGNIYNLEATPGEGTTYRFARLDKKRFGKIIVANENAYQKGAKPYYTNSTQLPVDFTDDVFEALDLQDGLQTRYTGGTVFHTFVGERMDKSGVKNLVNKISSKYHLPYFTITPTFSICPIHGYISGEHEYCPICDEEVEEGEKIIEEKSGLQDGEDLSYDEDSLEEVPRAVEDAVEKIVQKIDAVVKEIEEDENFIKNANLQDDDSVDEEELDTDSVDEEKLDDDSYEFSNGESLVFIDESVDDSVIEEIEEEDLIEGELEDGDLENEKKSYEDLTVDGEYFPGVERFQENELNDDDEDDEDLSDDEDDEESIDEVSDPTDDDDLSDDEDLEDAEDLTDDDTEDSNNEENSEEDEEDLSEDDSKDEEDSIEDEEDSIEEDSIEDEEDSIEEDSNEEDSIEDEEDSIEEDSNEEDSSEEDSTEDEDDEFYDGDLTEEEFDDFFEEVKSLEEKNKLGGEPNGTNKV